MSINGSSVAVLVVVGWKFMVVVVMVVVILVLKRKHRLDFLVEGSLAILIKISVVFKVYYTNSKSRRGYCNILNSRGVWWNYHKPLFYEIIPIFNNDTASLISSRAKPLKVPGQIMLVLSHAFIHPIHCLQHKTIKGERFLYTSYLKFNQGTNL